MSRRWHISSLPFIPVAIAALAIIASASAQSPSLTYDNLLQNPGFESGLWKWTTCSGEASVATDYYHSDGTSVRLSRASGLGPAAVCQTVPVTPLAGYSVSGYFYMSSDSARNGQVVVTWLPAGGATVYSPYCSEAGAWCLSSTSAQAPAAATSAEIRVKAYFNSSSAAAYADDIIFVQSGPPPSPTGTPTHTHTHTNAPSRTTTHAATASSTPTAVHTSTRTPLVTSMPTATHTPTHPRARRLPPPQPHRLPAPHAAPPQPRHRRRPPGSSSSTKSSTPVIIKTAKRTTNGLSCTIRPRRL